MEKNIDSAVIRLLSVSQSGDDDALKAGEIETPLGPMIAVGDEKALYLLEFMERKKIEYQVKKLRERTKLSIVSGIAESLVSIENELKLYFSGKLREFKTVFVCLGSSFQVSVWEELRKIPTGETRSYSELAKAIGRKTACRAVALANSTNRLAIIIPCHRVINANGNLGGYAGGIDRKAFLIEHEKRLA